MRVISLTIAFVATAVGCSNDNAAFDETAAGGASGMAGASSMSGSTGSGGSVATGGSGAAPGTGGKLGSGGAPGTGGAVGANGGSSGAGAGGKSGSGGVSGAGGNGGAGGKGGAAGRGGAAGAGGMSKGGAAGAIQDAGNTDAGDNADASLPVPTVEQLFPLAVGNVWNYNVTILPGSTGTSPCAAGMHATTITGRAMFANQDAFTATHVCSPTTTRYYVENAQGLQVNLGTTWSSVLPRPIADGEMFQAASSQQIIARVANITVPAGTFSNCWQTAYVSATGPVTTYCAGVGLVTLEYAAPSGGGYRIELTSYTLK